VCVYVFYVCASVISHNLNVSRNVFFCYVDMCGQLKQLPFWEMFENVLLSFWGVVGEVWDSWDSLY
jgi:hypothetical protein